MNDLIEISPSLFYKYSMSPHWLWYDIHADHSRKTELAELTKRLIEGGVLHESEYVKSIEKITVDENLPDDEAEKLTLKYMADGEKCIYQGAISYTDGGVKFKGRPDILKKCTGKSKFGDYYYVPVEIKTSKKCEDSDYRKQLMFYALILGKIQGFTPEDGEFINRDKESIKCQLTDKLLQSLNESILKILSILRGNEPLLKVTKEATQTPWGAFLIEEAERKSDIALLYNTNISVLEGLSEIGISTLDEMAMSDVNLLPKIKGASIDTLKRLHRQAVSLVNDEIIPLSKPIIPDATTKIYFDIEGDPLLRVEYLFGFWVVREGKEPVFKYFLAEKPEDEGVMWGEFLTWLKSENLVDYKVYHFHHYEKTQLKKLSEKYGGSDCLDRFVDNLVDLSPIVLNSYIFPIYFYSIKDIAKYLKFQWRNAKAGGAQSIFWYEEWLESGNRTILQDVIDYNEDDVRATEFLHKWLLTYKLEER